ncbi:MAG: hypothetical protein KGD73_00315 [Candidatus Lokiarchaeota archaeon]|nr:hypothetical protein [Candidatus Lokiarchaeota archaeon]
MATQVRYGSDYYEYLDLVQKLCSKINLIQKDQVQLIYKNFNIKTCKEELDKELELIEELLNDQAIENRGYS